jgi:O-methyltransferase involved in polyketide biosynthesis
MIHRVELSGVPETMLWTLHNRASDVKRPDAILRDPDAVRIYDTIDYDYERNFGKPNGAHALRSRLFDDALKPWIAAHRGATVVELGAGLETQCRRCDDGRVRWLSIDVPEAIALRERFLAPSERLRHISKSALDLTWLDHVDAARGVFVTAQGLFMYFDEADVRRLFVAVLDRFSGVEVMFDTIPRWFSKSTLRGFGKTKHYRVPPMPWGIDRGDIERTLRAWSARVASVEHVPFGPYRGVYGALLQLGARLPILKGFIPSVVHVRSSSAQR